MPPTAPELYPLKGRDVQLVRADILHSRAAPEIYVTWYLPLSQATKLCVSPFVAA